MPRKFFWTKHSECPKAEMKGLYDDDMKSSFTFGRLLSEDDRSVILRPRPFGLPNSPETPRLLGMVA
jgi:hypothetical protein